MNKTGFMRRSLLSATLAACVITGLTGCSEKTVEEHLQAAKAHIDAEDTQAAVIEYKNAIQLDPKAAQPRFELGKLYLTQGDYAGAEKELNRAMDLGQPASDVIPLLSQAYQRTGAENALADVDHKTAGLSAVEKAEVGFYKLQALMQLEKNEEAEALLEELSGLDTASVYKGLIDTYSSIIQKDYETALTQTQALREQAPSNKDVLMQLSRLYLILQQPEEAVEVYQAYIDRYPSDITSRFALISLLIELRQLDAAKPHVDELLKINDDHGLLNQYKGIIASSEGDYETALMRLEKAIQNGRNDPVVRLIAGFSAYQMQDFDAASRHLTMIASQLPDNHPGLRMLADSLLQQGESEDATAILDRVEGGMQEDAALFSKAGFQLLREGNIVDAQKMVDRTETVSTTSDDLARLGILQLSLNNVSGLVNLEAAVEKAPESVATQRTLMTAYIATGELEKARALAEQIREAKPETVLPYVYLADISLLEGNLEQSQSYLSQAKSVDASAPTVRMLEARYALANDNQENAVSVLNALIEDTPDNVEAITLLYSIKKENGGESVVRHVEQRLKARPGNLAMRILLSRMYFANDKLDSALATLSEVKPDKNTPMTYWNLKGQALVKSNDVKEATAHFSQWLELYPQDKNAALGMLLILDVQNKFADAISLTEAFLNKRPDSQIRVLKAYFHAMNREPQKARNIIEPLPDNVKSLPFVRGILGRVLVLENKPAEAIPHIQAAYEAKPNEQNALLLGTAHELAGQGEEALEFLQLHANAEPQDIRVYMLYAERLIPHDRNKAKLAYEHVLELVPDNYVVLNNLAYIYFEEGNLEKAEPLAARAVEQQPRNPDIVDTLAQIEMSLGKTQKALSLYEGIANERIRSDDVFLNYVEALLLTDKTALAKRKLEDRTLTSQAAISRLEEMKQTFGL
ncbi:XrtA/PEP-CTERM system TPR-repeat protein PrsT [Alteromonas antoniana]|uniref:XrtA/PEP-CTERM system TPR-repeat protein PrsT n=1 Tax=Alteromonas antoniana TaxID=2803813 RepID=UPI001C453DCA|nr:XrtA/PEP-CTERM system TPR-repeat protein PrsT [Alteromonas antoniana]